MRNEVSIQCIFSGYRISLNTKPDQKSSQCYLNTEANSESYSIVLFQSKRLLIFI